MAKVSNSNMSFLQHLEVLRWHLVRSSIAIIIGAIVCFVAKGFLFDVVIFGPKKVDFVTYQLFCKATRALGTDELFCMKEMPFKILNTKMAGQFSTHMWVSIIGGFIMAFPYVLFELWRFVSPGMHNSERKYGRVVIIAAGFLFMAGVLFGYYLIAPLSVQFLGTYTVSSEITNFIDLLSYISTISTVTLASGILFELPIIVYFLAKIGVITPQGMRQYRRHAIVVILVLSAVITPPDLTSQILVSLPVLILYELSIKICARVVRRQQKALAKSK